MPNPINPKAASTTERRHALDAIRLFKQSNEMRMESAQLYSKATRATERLGASCFDLANEKLESELLLVPSLQTPFGAVARLIISFHDAEMVVSDIQYITDDGKSNSLKQLADIYR